jgi:hypothetical protein
LWISPEMLPGVVWGIAALAAAWSVHPGKLDRGVFSFVIFFFLFCALILFIDPPKSGFWFMDFGRFSWPMAALSGLTGLAWTAAFIFAGKNSRPGIRFAAITLSLAAAAVFFFIGFRGPFQADETLKAAELLSHCIREYKSPLDDTPGSVLFVAGRMFLGLGAAVWLVWADRKKHWHWAWICFLALLGGYSILALRHMRFIVYTDVLALIPLAVLGGRALAAAEKKQPHPALRFILLLMVLFGPAFAGVLIEVSEKKGDYFTPFEKRFAAQPQILERWKEQLKNREPDCDLKGILPLLQDPAFMGPGSRTIATSLNDAPELLYKTAHQFIAGPYGSYAALRDVVDFFYTAPVLKAREIAEARGVDYVLACPFHYGWHQPPHPDSLFVHFVMDRPVPWLEEAAWPENIKTDFRLWRVKFAAEN